VKGFTLLEILVSTAILSIVLAGIYAAFTSNVEVIEAARSGGEKQQSARIALDRMTKDLASAYISPGGRIGEAMTGMILEDLEVDGRPADVLNFTSLAHVSPGRGGPTTDLCKIGYYLEEDEENGGFLLYRRDSLALDEEIAEGGPVRVLAMRVTGLDFVFEDASGNEMLDWDSISGDKKQRNTLPSFVRINLRISDRKGRQKTFVTGVRPELADLTQAP